MAGARNAEEVQIQRERQEGEQYYEDETSAPQPAPQILQSGSRPRAPAKKSSLAKRLHAQNSQKVQTGVQALDSLFGGGVPNGSNILLHGEPLCGKKLLLMQFAYEGLKSGIPAIFVLVDFGYTEWKLKMRKIGMDLAPFEKQGILHAVDCYSKQFEPSLQNTESIHYAQSPASLSSISLAISASQEIILENYKTHRVALHSLSSLLEESDSQDFYKFLQFHTGKLRAAGAASLFSMEKGMHSKKDFAMVEHLMDAVVDFEGGKISAKGLGAPKTSFEYSISAAGLQLK